MKIVEVIKDSLYDSIRAVLVDIGHKNTRIVFDNEGGLEPKNTYCVISILSRERQGRTQESTYLTEDEFMWRTEFFKIYIQLTFIGNSSADISWNFDDSFPASRTYIEEFQKRNLGFIKKSALRRSPQPRETKWVDSWNVDLELSFAIQSRQTMDWVEYITLDGQVIKIYNKDGLRDRRVDTGEERKVYVLKTRQVYPTLSLNKK